MGIAIQTLGLWELMHQKLSNWPMITQLKILELKKDLPLYQHRAQYVPPLKKKMKANSC